MKNKPPARFLSRWLVALLLVPLAWGYDIARYNGQPITWNPGTVSMQLQLGSSTVLSDGSDHNSSVQTALQLWNAQLGTVQFANQVVAAAAPIDHNGINEIGFDNTVYGTAFDANVLAVAMYYYSATPREDGTYRRTQADIIFNSAYTWDSYRGAWRSTKDIQRVALHELGHVLGLKHPDLASPVQYVTALMNSQVSNLDTLASDDINGAQFLYGTPSVAPSITGQPANQTVYAGQNTQFGISASGNPAPTYQWQRLPAGSGTWVDISNAGAYSGTGTTTLSIISATTAMSGDQFRCVATNSVGLATSSSATLTVNPAVLPVISGLPATVTLGYGGTLSLSPSVTGTEPLSFEWKKNGVDLGGATSSSYNKSNATPTDSGIYMLIATNAAGPVTSSSVTVTVNPAEAPTITLQPASLSIIQGSTVNLSVTATGTNPMTYQWYLTGTQLPGATSSILNIPNVQLAQGGNYTVVITNPGGSTTSNAGILNVSPLWGIVSVTAGNAQSLIIKSDGTLWGMGYNAYGQLGDGTTTARSSPVQIVTGVVFASAGWDHNLFIKSDGALWAMGYNSNGQLGDGTTTDRSSPVQIASGVVLASAGFKHSLFIKSDGTLWAMGANYAGQLGDGTMANRSSPVQIATGVVFAVTGETGDHDLFIKSDGTLWAMGYNNYGQLGDGTMANRSSPVQIAAGVVFAATGTNHSLFIKSDGTLWAMGFNNVGQLGDGTIISRSSPVQITAGVVFAAAGEEHSLFIQSDSTLWGMGSNGFKELGIVSLPVKVPNPVKIAAGVVFAGAGSHYSLFIKSDGTLWGMGNNHNGQLGDGTTIDRVVPKLIVTGSVTMPGAPFGVTASVYPSGGAIRLTWRPTISATSYEIWRGTTNNPASAIRIANNISIALFYDVTVVSGTNYYYWIKAVNSAGASSFSDSAVSMIIPSNAVITITIQ